MPGPDMRIPKIVHQLWKDEIVPRRWRGAVESVKRYHSDWEYRLWTDAAMDGYVRTNHPDLYAIFCGFNRHIMRVDVFRYILMHDIGGLYCDLDYEFIRPFDYGDAEMVLSYEFEEAYGDSENQFANYILASVQGHDLWKDMLADIRANPPHSATAPDVCIVTGPQFVTRVFSGGRDRYSGVMLAHKPVLSPRRVHGRHERRIYLNSGITYGFHHGWGSWKERLTLPYLRHKLRKYVEYLKRPHI